MINDYEATRPMTTDAIPVDTDTISNDDIITTLNGLIQTYKDGEEGFKAAAENVKAATLKTLFYKRAEERSRFVSELRELVLSFGQNPESAGTLLAAAHRGWMDFKTTIFANDGVAILNECERGEDSAKNAYIEALEKPLPNKALDVVKMQSTSINESHDNIKYLRDQANNEAEQAAAAAK